MHLFYDSIIVNHSQSQTEDSSPGICFTPHFKRVCLCVFSIALVTILYCSSYAMSLSSCIKNMNDIESDSWINEDSGTVLKYFPGLMNVILCDIKNRYWTGISIPAKYTPTMSTTIIWWSNTFEPLLSCSIPSVIKSLIFSWISSLISVFNTNF